MIYLSSDAHQVFGVPDAKECLFGNPVGGMIGDDKAFFMVKVVTP